MIRKGGTKKDGIRRPPRDDRPNPFAKAPPRPGAAPRGPSRDVKRGPSRDVKRGLDARGPQKRGFDKRAPEKRGLDARGPQKRGLDARGPEKRGFDKRAPEKRGFDKRAPEKRGFDKRAPEKRGFDKRAPEKRAPEKRGFDKRAPEKRGPERSERFENPRSEQPALRPMTQQVTFPAPSPPRIGDWLFTTRPDAELDLLEELAYANEKEEIGLPRIAGPALVATPKRPKVELAFARQGFPVVAIASLDDPRAPTLAAQGILGALPIAQGRSARARGPQPFSIDAWVPDDDRSNRDSAKADELGERAAAALRSMSSTWAPHLVKDARGAWQENGLMAQICVAEGQVYVGVTPAREAPSLAPGGRMRIHIPQHAPSRAAAKLLEAFAWLDRAPGPGDMCVDLGAAPGGWSWVLLDRGAKVLAVDPGRLAPIVAKHRGLTHLRADAFTFQPEEPVDWLVADMAWRPLEAAALYGKWGRRRWARLLIANIKLPMRKKAEYLLRVKDILTQSGWQNLRARQLYHDREEVTLAGVRL